MSHSEQTTLTADERLLLADVTGDEAWQLVERFAALRRESGSEDERQAAAYVVERLRAYGVPVEVHTPRLYLSLPRGAEIRAGDVRVRGKTPSFSVSTGPAGRSGRLVYVPSGFARGSGDLFESGLSGHGGERDLEGAVAITEGLPLPQKVTDLQARGAVAAIFVNPGERIHEAICTPIWGAPDLDNQHRRPALAVAAVNRFDGQRLIERARAGGIATVETHLEEGLYPCPVVVATIPGAVEPDAFVLLHGHLDAWHVGVGDNAVGDGALLEVALALWKHRQKLRRSVRVAWWPGHSQGRYAGSTWYADTFGVDLAEHCVAHLNCDSPGCRWAERFDDLCWTPELEAFVRDVIRDGAGQEARGGRPPRAGDYSFQNLGISGAFMLSSTMPDELREAKGYYGVGGCGGNIEWHTEADTLEVADRRLLQRDTRVYALATWRLATVPVLPLRFRAMVADMHEAARRYAALSEGRVDLEPVLRALQELDLALVPVEEMAAGAAGPAAADDAPALREINRALVELSRILVPLHFAREGRFRQDPALQVPPLPDLAFAERLSAWPDGSLEAWFASNSLVRGRNRVVYELHRARQVAQQLAARR
ncbi:M28 family metallopeptidase [Carboxydochorda subterranea]|uniref:M28 family metallopeptidase n=1 Tax=Carboxydichorda subterranea TaxID=3109565 RepID=A0ABZ1BYD7_9FIRM|nr:M28 family metallopeptidase [Limnochorda sp. L945t]WRP17595.1 M28 family metallopeptidase [Limnochorda sp. L945t]